MTGPVAFLSLRRVHIEPPAIRPSPWRFLSPRPGPRRRLLQSAVISSARLYLQSGGQWFAPVTPPLCQIAEELLLFQSVQLN